MPNIGPAELVVVLVIALLILGPKRLPEVGKSLGRGIANFKDGLSTRSEEPAPALAPAMAEPSAVAATSPRLDREGLRDD
jgi:sec-independent protein translocase protein TatA